MYLVEQWYWTFPFILHCYFHLLYMPHIFVLIHISHQSSSLNDLFLYLETLSHFPCSVCQPWLWECSTCVRLRSSRDKCLYTTRSSCLVEDQMTLWNIKVQMFGVAPVCYLVRVEFCSSLKCYTALKVRFLTLCCTPSVFGEIFQTLHYEQKVCGII